MVGALLLRGMLVGVVAGLLCFGFLKVAGEPSVDKAIAFESALDTAKAAAEAQARAAKGMPAPKAEPEPELVSRRTQAGIGLFTGVVVFSAAFGGLFALAFAFAYGRIGEFSPRGVAALLALFGFVTVYLVPTLKYPANPPSVGDPDTIGIRTALYFGFIAVSLLAAIAAGMLRGRFERRLGGWNSVLLAGGLYIAVMIATGLALPAVNEVPEQFPAVALWQFRIASGGAQAILWSVLGLGFGALAARTAGVTPRALRLNSA